MSEHPLQAQLRALYARASRGMRLGLDAMERALRAAGSPERCAEVVHLAGTNGKGSVSAMLSAALRAHGHNVGCYTSPHLSRFAERIAIGGAAIDDDALCAALARTSAAGPELSFFEAATLAAYCAFEAAGCDVIVLEVGLGGRFDATNSAHVRKRACAITSIGYDHQAYLGNDLPSIAREKAGILRANVPCVLGRMPREAAQAIERCAQAVGAEIVHAPALRAPISLHLAGTHQQHNAEVALALCAQLGLDAQRSRQAIAAARWPGRYESIDSASGRYWLDGAHNLDGAKALAALLAARAKPLDVLLFGAMADKPAAQMLALLRPHARALICVAPPGRAAHDPAQLAAPFAGEACTDWRAALQRARQIAGDGEVLIAGSLYLVGVVRSHLLKLPSDPMIAM